MLGVVFNPMNKDSHADVLLKGGHDHKCVSKYNFLMKKWTEESLSEC